MTQYSEMNRVDDVVGPNLPVSDWPQGVVIPGRSFQQGSAARQRRELELALFRNQKATQMGRIDFVVRCPFLKRRGIARDRES